LAQIDFSALPEVVMFYEEKKMSWNSHEERDGLTGAMRFEQTYLQIQERLRVKEMFLYPLTIVCRTRDVQLYYKIMRKTQVRIKTIMSSIDGKQNLELETFDLLPCVLSLILGSFDRRLPTTLNGGNDTFAADFFRPNALKENVAKGQTSHEYFDFLKDLLAYALTLRIGIHATRMPPVVREQVDSFHNIINVWLKEIQDEKRTKEQQSDPQWESSESELDALNKLRPEQHDTPQDGQQEQQEAPQAIHTSASDEGKQKYRESMYWMISAANTQWQRIASESPDKWVAAQVPWRQLVFDLLTNIANIHDFGVQRNERRTATGTIWYDIQPTRVTTESLEEVDASTGQRANNSFLKSVCDTLQKSLLEADSITLNVWFVKAHQRAIGFALICVKRLFMQWCLDGTYIQKFKDKYQEETQAKLDEYQSSFKKLLCTLTLWQRVVACYRVVQNMEKRELDYEHEHVLESGLTRWQLETPTIGTVMVDKVQKTGKKYRLKNPLNYPDYNQVYAAHMQTICESAHAHFRECRGNPSRGLHKRASESAFMVELSLGIMGQFPLGREAVVKTYESFRWNNTEGKKTNQTIQWIDYIVTRPNGQHFFKALLVDFQILRRKFNESVFRNVIFPESACYSRQYIKQFQYLKTSLKRVLYMIDFRQIVVDDYCRTQILICIEAAYRHVEFVRAIHCIQESENRSLKYKTAKWGPQCLGELLVPPTRPIQEETERVAHWGT
jgi:hypothetical protein